MDRQAWWAAVYGVAQSWTRLKRLRSSSSSSAFRWVYLSFSPSPLFYFFYQQFVIKLIEQPCGEDDTVFILHVEILGLMEFG